MEQDRPEAAGDREEGPDEEVPATAAAVRVYRVRAGNASARHAVQRRRTARGSLAARPHVRGAVRPWCGGKAAY